MTQKLISAIILFLPGMIGFSQAIDDLYFLDGTWKAEGKETYEVWEKDVSTNQLSGRSYKLADGKEIVSEYLNLTEKNGQIIYSATVLNQNDGKPVPFILSQDISKGFSFENPAHDFPTKIIYQKKNDTELVVHVMGSDGKGFAIKFTKQ